MSGANIRGQHILTQSTNFPTFGMPMSGEMNSIEDTKMQIAALEVQLQEVQAKIDVEQNRLKKLEDLVERLMAELSSSPVRADQEKFTYYKKKRAKLMDYNKMLLLRFNNIINRLNQRRRDLKRIEAKGEIVIFLSSFAACDIDFCSGDYTMEQTNLDASLRPWVELSW